MDVADVMIRIGQQLSHCRQKIFNKGWLGEHDVGARTPCSIDGAPLCVGGEDENCRHGREPAIRRSLSVNRVLGH